MSVVSKSVSKISPGLPRVSMPIARPPRPGPSAFQKVCRSRCHRVSTDQSAQLERIHPGSWADKTILTPVPRCAGECRFVRVARVLDVSWPRTCVALVLAAAAPVSRRACTPDRALSQWHARQPAAVNAGHFHPMPAAARRSAAADYPLAWQPSRYPSARPGMTHRDEQHAPTDQKHPHNADSVSPLRPRWSLRKAYRSTGYGRPCRSGPDRPYDPTRCSSDVADLNRAGWSALRRGQVPVPSACSGQVLAGGVRIGRVLQRGRGRGRGPVSVIPGPVELPVHPPLDPAPYRAEQGRHGQGGGGHLHRGVHAEDLGGRLPRPAIIAVAAAAISATATATSSHRPRRKRSSAWGPGRSRPCLRPPPVADWQRAQARAAGAIRRPADVLAAAAGVTWAGEGLRDEGPGDCQRTGPARPGGDRQR